MVVLPKDDPVFTNLNAYYLDIARLIEHLQGEVGSGGVFFKSYRAEGALFFDQDDIIAGILESREESLFGQEAVDRLLVANDQYNFNVCVYRIGPENVYFWASLPGAEKIYKDLSTEFTDLDGLINKMGSERLTGYIDVHFADDNARGMIFLINGKMMGAACSWSDASAGVSIEARSEIVRKTRDQDAIFDVCQIPVTEPETEVKASLEPVGASEDVLFALAEFLSIFEQTVSSMRRSQIDFTKMLKQKFVENAEKYTFLDPFAAEFEYDNHRIVFKGHATGKELSRGVIFSVFELADELGLRQKFSNQLEEWSERHGGKLIGMDIMV
jgi:hypothetical protein